MLRIWPENWQTNWQRALALVVCSFIIAVSFLTIAVPLASARQDNDPLIDSQTFPPVTETPQPYVPYADPYIAASPFFDDGTDHYQDYPEQIRDGITVNGKDIKFSLSDGRVVNASQTYYELWKRYQTAKAAATGREAKMLAAFRGSYEENQAVTRGDTGLYTRRFIFVERANSDGLYFVDNPFQIPMQPGDIVHDNIVYGAWLDDESPVHSSTVRLKAVYARPYEKEDETWADQTRAPFYYDPVRNVKIDGQPVASYATPDHFADDESGSFRPPWIPLWDRSQTSASQVMRLVQYDFTVPPTATWMSAVPDFHTVGERTVATVVTTFATFRRLPEIRIHNVLDKDYRKALGYSSSASPLLPRLEHNAQINNYDAATTQQLKDNLFLPLGISDINGTMPDFLKDLYNNSVYHNPDDIPGIDRVYDDTQPRYRSNFSSEQWEALKIKEIDGYIYIDNDIHSDKVKYNYIVDPASPTVMLTKEYYRTYRPIPAAVKLVKHDASNEETKLPGAVFELWNADHSVKLSDELFTTDSNGEVSFYHGGAEQLSNSEFVKSLPVADDAGVIATSENGILLEPGTYSLKEVTAPENYVLPSDPWTTFTVPVQTTEYAGTMRVIEISNTQDTPPTTPATPVIPDNPANPSVPTTPSTPAKPGLPSIPAQPTEPPTPQTPAVPQTPITPQTPSGATSTPPTISRTGTDSASLTIVAGILLAAGVGALTRRKLRNS